MEPIDATSTLTSPSLLTSTSPTDKMEPHPIAPPAPKMDGQGLKKKSLGFYDLPAEAQKEIFKHVGAGADSFVRISRTSEGDCTT